MICRLCGRERIGFREVIVPDPADEKQVRSLLQQWQKGQRLKAYSGLHRAEAVSMTCTRLLLSCYVSLKINMQD